MLRAYSACMRKGALAPLTPLCTSVRHYRVPAGATLIEGGSATASSSSTSQPPASYASYPPPPVPIRAAAIVRRYPTINPEKNEFEKLWLKHFLEGQDEHTIVDESEFERLGIKFVGQKQQDVEKARRERDRRIKEKEEEDKAGPSGLRSKAGEVDEDKLFKPAPRITKADETNDRRSLERKLMGGLTLIVKDDATGEWRFPETEHDSEIDEVDLRHTAQRVVKQEVGTFMKVWFHGYSPIHFINNVDPADEDSIVSKTFFFSGRYVRGDVIWQPDAVSDHAWVSNAELADYFSKEYIKSIQPVLMEHTLYPHPDFAEVC